MAGENINRKLNIYINDREIVNSARGINSEMAKVRNQMKALNKGTDDYDKKLKELSDTYSRLKTKQAEFTRELNGTTGVLDRIKKSLGPIGVGFLAAFSVSSIVSGVASKISDAARKVVDFDQKQADLAATMNKTRTQIAGLTLDAIRLGATTSYSASEVSLLQTELAKLGKSGTEIKAMTKDVLNTATALETDLGSAAVLVGGQLNSYGENANQAAKYSDIMANSVNISATSYDYLATSLPKVSAVAAQNGVEFARLNGILGVLADQNIQAETAGTGFRNILLESAKAGKPYQQMLDEIKNSANQSKTAVELFGKENATVAVILANSTDKINDNTLALENSAGSAEKLAKEKLNSIKGSIEGFSGAWEGFLLSIEKGDGYIARTVRGIVDWGTSLLNLITPMERLSDQIQKEQLDLNMLVSRITSTNISNEERKRLLVQLKTEYPDFIKNINIETVSNKDLNDTLDKVNENYVKRIALQKQVENVEDAQKDSGDALAQKLAIQEKLFTALNKMKVKYNLDVDIDFGKLEKSASKIVPLLRNKNVEDGWFGQIANIEGLVSKMGAWEGAIKRSNAELNNQTGILNRQQKQLGINTEAQNEANVAAAAQAEILRKLREEAKGFGMKNADTATEQELKLFINAYRERQRYRHQDTEEDRKKKEKALEDAKKHSEDLKKDLERSEKELLDTHRKFDDVLLANKKDSYEKERALLREEYDRKIEDIRIKIAQENEEIALLEKDVKDKNNTPADVAILKKTISNKLAMIKEYNGTAELLVSQHNIKLATLQEKYINQSFKEEQEQAKLDLENLKRKQQFELFEINSLHAAKAFLSDKLSSEELSKITTLEQGKKAIKQIFLQEQYDLEVANLEKIIGQYQTFLELDMSAGFQLLSDEERESMLKFLDEAKVKLAAITSGKNEDPDAPASEFKSGIDILGFSPERWQEVYSNLDTFQGKLAGIQMVASVLTNAFSTYFKFLEAGENRSLAQFERAANRKKAALDDQLAKGQISQELYNIRVKKNEEELAQKKFEIAYKQAKRQKAMGIVEAVINTSIAIMQAYSQLGPIGGTIAAVLIGTLGALQIATIAKQPLPERESYYEGGYTGDGSPTSISTKLGNKDYDYHNGEYMVPNKVLFSNDPAVPYIIDYLEAKRTGKSPTTSPVSENSSTTSSTTTPEYSTNTTKLESILERLTIVLDRIERNGLEAYLTDDIPTAKKIRERIKKLEAIENQAKK